MNFFIRPEVRLIFAEIIIICLYAGVSDKVGLILSFILFILESCAGFALAAKGDRLARELRDKQDN
jgi:UPF0716 family protein affecting phage T7 exclusion